MLVLNRSKKRSSLAAKSTASIPDTSNASGGYEKKKGFTAKKSNENKPYSEDDIKGF